MANYVSQVKANNTTYDVRELYPHVGTCSDAAGTAAKTVTIGNFKLYTGAWVVVKFANTNSAAVASLTLNIDGTGAKPIKYRNANLGSAGQLVANRYTMFIYDGTNYQYVGDINSNDNTYDRNRYNANIKAGSNALVAGNIIVGKDGVYNHLKSGAAFDVSYPILYNNGAVAAGATTTNTYDILHFTVTTTQSITLTAYLPVYIKGTLAGKIFTPIGTSPLTQTIPTTADGYHYIYLGTATGTTTVYLQEMHPIYAYMNGAFGLAAVNATYASTAGAVAWSGVTSKPTEFTPASGSNYYIKNYTGASRSTATTKSWVSMMNSTSTGSPTLPTTGKWWQVLSLDCWNSAPNNWVSQLALPTQDDSSIYYRKNPSTGTSIESGTWIKVLDVNNFTSHVTPSAIGAAPAVTGGYLPLSGGTMTGAINLVANKYGASECGMDCKNSNIVGVNQVKFCDLSDDATEGIMFYRDGTNWDSLWAASGVLYFTPNYSTSTTNNVVLHSGNYTSYGYPLSIAADSGTNQLTMYANTKYKLTAGGSTYIFTTPPNANYLSNQRDTAITYGANKLEWYDLSGNNGTNVTKKQNPTNDWYHHITMHHANANGYFVDIAACFHSNSIYYRRVASGADASSGWVRLIDSSNIGSQTVASAATATSATSADKLTTARTISLGTDLQGGASFDGSGNITIGATNYRCSVDGGNKANYPWHRIAYVSGITNTYHDRDAVFAIRSAYNGGPFGIIKVSLRTNASGATVDIGARWMVRYGFEETDVVIAKWGTTGQSVYADIFVKCSTYTRRKVYQMFGDRSWTLVSSNEVNDTTTSDKKTSTEVYATVASAGTEIHNQAYTSTVNANDVGIVNTAMMLRHKTLNSTTINNTAGSFAFSGEGAPWAGTDWVGLQIGDSVDKWQITGTGSDFLWRQNDNGGTNTSWGDWKTFLDSSNYTSYTVTKTGGGASGSWGINITGSANSATTATTATNANNVYHTLTNPASETTYGVSFFSGISSGNKAMLTNDGIKHITREGSTSVSGYSIISMGNTIDNSTAGGKRGYVRLYGAGQYYAQLTPAAVTWSSNLDIYIPNKGGTMSVFGTVPGSDGKVIISDGTAGGIKSSGYTIATSVPSGAVFTDTKVTSSANHYTPSTASGSDISKSASGATAAWSIDVVKGITLNTDGKGHVTGLSVTSGKIPANPNTNTTYTLGTSGNNVTLTPSSGSVQSITVPYATKAQYPMVAAGNEIRFFNNNEFTLDRHFWFGYQWADGSRYTPSGSDTPVTGDAALTAPNITKFIMGNCTQGGLASVHAKSFILGNGTDPTASSATTTITTAATTTGRTITLPDADGTVSLVGHTHSYAGSASAGGPATSVNTSAASDNVSRVVFFAYNGDTSKVVYDSDFKYNPSTNILTVGNVNGRLYYSGSSCSWWNDRDYAVIRVTTGDTGYRPLWSLLTATTGSWAMGNHTGDDLTFNFISKTVYDSKANPSAYKQIKFTADGDIKAQRYLYGTYLNISCGDESSSFASSATILYCLNTSSDNFVRKASLSTIANAAIPAITETGTGTPTDTDYYISQWAGGSASNPVNTTPVKRQHSALWAYINGKISASSSGSGNGVTSVSYANGVITYTKGSTFLTSHQSVSDKNVTLAWGTQKTIATIGSTDIHVTLPSNPNTNTTYTLGTSTDTTVTPNEDTVTLTPSSGSVQSIKVPYAKRAKYVYTDSIGSGAASHAAALQTYFNANKDSINRNSLLGYFSNAEQNGSICMGYFISGYNDNPYGGFFVAHYNTPKYVGISSGTFTQHTLLSNQNYTDYTVKKDGTGATGSWGINITGNAATCTTASEMLTRFTAGTYGTSYALWWGADTTSTDNTSNYARRNGTATIQFRSDTSGWTEIFLGNSTATGNAGSSTGWLGLYSDGTGCHHLSGLTTNSAATHYLPATSGTILNSGTTSFTQTLTSGTKIGEIKINDSSTNIYCSDANVTQTGVDSTYTNYRPLLISDSSSASAPPGAATVTGGTYITSSIYCQPSSGTVYASKFVGPLQGNADTATKAYTTVTSGTTSIARYGVVFAANSNTSGNESLCKSYDFRLNVTNGSTSADGNCELVIGNGTASGTAGNKQGYITLYSSGQGYHMIGTAATNNAISHTFPASSGTILNTATGLQLSGGTMTGNLKMTEGKNFILRTHANNTYKAGIGYDTKGNECIALWACNKVTRLRWHAGTDMESMSSGTMMNVANPDFEITKADDQVNPKGFIGKGRIGTTDTLWTSSTTGDTSVAIVIPNSATYLKVWLFNSTASIYTVHEVLIDTTIKTSAVIQTATRGQSGFNLTLSPVTFSLTYTEAVTGAKKYTISVDVGSSIGIINGQYPVLGTQPTVKIVKIMACS